MDEFELIERFFRKRARATEVGIGDDAAIVRATPGTELYVAVDTLVAGRHFPPGIPPPAIGYRALAVNLSDLAAMAATPRWATLALTVPDPDESWLAGFAAGFFGLADRFGVDLIGGDTTEGPLTVSVQIIGEAPHATRVLRSTARAGDDIYVSGSTGDAAAGLALFDAAPDPANESARRLIDRFLWPSVRLDMIGDLRRHAHAAIDISDGLLADLVHVLAASAVGADVEVERVPLSSSLTVVVGADEALRLALVGGDDYELCFTAPVEARSALTRPGLTRIGVVSERSGLRLSRNGESIPLPERTGFRHFSGGAAGV